MFTPLLKKYSNRTVNDDAFSELTLSFLQCIKKIPLEKEDFKNDAKYILSSDCQKLKFNQYFEVFNHATCNWRRRL